MNLINEQKYRYSSPIFNKVNFFLNFCLRIFSIFYSHQILIPIEHKTVLVELLSFSSF